MSKNKSFVSTPELDDKLSAYCYINKIKSEAEAIRKLLGEALEDKIPKNFPLTSK